MRYQKWMLEREPEWQRLEALLDESAQSVYQLSPDEVREMGLLYRGLMNDLSRARTSPEYQHLVPYLNNMALRCHSRVYESPPARWQNVLHFFVVSFPQCFRKNFNFIFLSFAMFVLGSIVAAATVKLDPSTANHFLSPAAIDLVKRGELWVDHMEAAPSESSFLMTHNIQVAMRAYAGGMLFGVGALFYMFFNGMFAFGGPLQVCYLYNMGNQLLNFVMAHGVIELTTIFIAGGGGMLVGFAMLFPGDLPRWEAVRKKAWESLVLIMGCFPLLVIAGTIEGMVSLNKDVSTAVRTLVAVSSAVFLIVYLGFSGLDRSAEKN